MVLLRYLLMVTGICLLAAAAGILVWDLYLILKSRKSTQNMEGTEPPHFEAPGFRWHAARRLATLALAPLLIGISIAVVPSGFAGVRVNQFVGTRPATLYPGVHWIVPLIENMELYDIRDNIFTTSMVEDPKQKATSLRVQTREG